MLQFCKMKYKYVDINGIPQNKVQVKSVFHTIYISLWLPLCLVCIYFSSAYQVLPTSTHSTNSLGLWTKQHIQAPIKSVTWKLLNTVCPDVFCGKLRFLLEETPGAYNITGQKLLSKMTKEKRDLDENTSNMLPIQKSQSWKQKADSHLPKTSPLRQWQFPLLTFVPWEIWGGGRRKLYCIDLSLCSQITI